MTYKEIVFICKDLLKIITDDASFEDEHVIFLAGKFRSLLLKKYYDTPKKPAPDAAYQTICLDLKLGDTFNICNRHEYLKSVQALPYTMPIGGVRVYPIDFTYTNINYVTSSRFPYVGINDYTKNMLYTTIGPDNHLYLRSGNPQFKYLKKVKVTAIFENVDSKETIKLLCKENKPCDELNNECDDIMEQRFPIEEALIPELIELIVKELMTGLYHPADLKNNAKDDLSDVMQFIRQNMKDKYLKEYGG